MTATTKIASASLFTRRASSKLNQYGHKAGALSAHMDELLAKGGTVQELAAQVEKLAAEKGLKGDAVDRLRGHMAHLESEWKCSFVIDDAQRVKLVPPAPAKK